MTNYELKKWELKENKTIIKLEGENNTEKTIEINNTYENIMLLPISFKRIRHFLIK